MKYLVIQFFLKRKSNLVTTITYYLQVKNKSYYVCYNTAKDWALANTLYKNDEWAFCIMPADATKFEDYEQFIGERVLI